MTLNLFLAFAAGLLSFFSPCVLPLIPSYLCVIGGISWDELQAGSPDTEGKRAARPRLVPATLFFIAGFSVVFIVLSLLFSSMWSLAGGASRYINIAAGIVVILLGLNIIFDFLPFLNYEKRPKLSSSAPFLAGAAFGAGWTP